MTEKKSFLAKLFKPKTVVAKLTDASIGGPIVIDGGTP